MDRATLPRLTLPGTPPSITTSRVGFGTVGLTSLNDRAKALRLLESAFDAGITHFDAARLYGSGQSEGILGEFIRGGGKRDRVTIMTKFGKEPPKLGGGGGGGGGGGAAGKVKRMVKWGMQRSGFIKKLVSSAANKATIRGKFDPASAQASLDTSLRELGTDYVDFLMLHDCTLEDTQRADTIEFLQQQMKKGTVRAFGATMSAAVVAGGDLTVIPSTHTALQFPSSTLEPTIESVKGGLAGRAVFTCRPIKCAVPLAAAARKHAALARPFAARLGIDPTNADDLAGLLLRDALARNSTGVVVFSTTNPARIAANLRSGLAQGSADQSAMLTEFVQALASHAQKP